VSRHMGLFAVAHLAARHGVLVRLQSATTGTIAQVWLPAAIAVGGAAGQVPADLDMAGPRADGFLQAAVLRQTGAQQALPRADGGQPGRRAATGSQPAAGAGLPVPPPADAPSGPSTPARSGRAGGLPVRVPRTRRGGRHAASQLPPDPRAPRRPSE
jgi:hypothetical protein